MNVLLRKPWSVDSFLAWEDKQEARHEFDGTHIIEMADGSRDHQRIVANLLRLLEDALDPARFDVVQEMRIDLGGKVRYPDIAVVAGPIGGTVRTLSDAVVLFEVLPDDTAATDRGAKREEYRRLRSIRRYVLVEQNRADVRVLTNQPDGWLKTSVFRSVELLEIGATLPLQEIYRGVAPR